MAENTINLTAEDIDGAITYMPLAQKELLSRNIALFCLEPVEVKVGTTGGGEALPNRVRENRKLRQQYEMGLLAHYLQKPYPEQKVIIEHDEQELSFCMDEDEYDRWASSHIFNQLERLKKSKTSETANKVFDLLYDYKNLCGMLSWAIRDELDTRNDVFNRAAEYLVEMLAQDAMKSIMENREKFTQEIQKSVEDYEKAKAVMESE